MSTDCHRRSEIGKCSVRLWLWALVAVISIHKRSPWLTSSSSSSLLDHTAAAAAAAAVVAAAAAAVVVGRESFLRDVVD